MTYDLIILRKEWFFHESPEHHATRFQTLRAVINKAYSKMMNRYGLITTVRIKNPESLLDDLQFSPKKEVSLAILLGSHETFADLESKHGYTRKFNQTIHPLTDAHNSDIPAQYASAFGPLTKENVRVIELAPDCALDSSILDRVVATVGYKTFSDEYTPNAPPDVKQYELTAYTSYSRGAGPRLLEFMSKQYFVDQTIKAFDLGGITKVILHAVVIKEHDLVPYYIKTCDFVLSPQPEILVSASGQGDHIEFGVCATADFHLSFLYKELAIASA